MNCNLYLGDSYAMLEPYISELVTKKLTYWHRNMSFNNRDKNAPKGETKKLYFTDKRVSRVTQEVADHLITLPGFALLIKDIMEEDGYTVNFIDDRSTLPVTNIPHALSGLRDYQKLAAYNMLKSYGGILACPTGWGKCLSVGTKVLMTNGTTKSIEDILPGEQVMGMDSTPRNVLGTKKGFGAMYTLTPKRGESMTVADDHILTLVTTDTNKIVDVMVSDYLTKSKTFKHRHKLFRVAVDFPEKKLRVDPYYLGLWLGDGSKHKLYITNPDKEVITAIKEYASHLGLSASTYVDRKSGCPTTSIVNKVYGEKNTLLDNMRSYGLLVVGDLKKFVPHDFQVNSRENRLEILAGLLDSDGHLNEGTGFDFVNMHKDITDSVAFIAGSLGFGVHKTLKPYKGFGKEGLAYRVRICGDTHLIPTKIARKQAIVRAQKKNVLRSGFTVTRAADSEYFGIAIDGDHRYVCGDFTVTHNTHLMASIIRGFRLDELNARDTPLTVVVTPGKDLAAKNAEALRSVLQNERKVGLVCTGSRDFSDDVQVVTPESLKNLDLSQCGLLLYDEAHTLSSARADMVMQATKAIRYGFSATPTGRSDGADMIVEGVFGPVVYRRTYQQAVDDGAVVPISVIWVPTDRPYRWKDPKQRDTVYKHAVWDNPVFHALTRSIMNAIPPDMQTLAVVDKLSHMDGVVMEMPDITYVHATERGTGLAKISPKIIEGVNKAKRARIYKEIESGMCKRAVASGIYRTGVDFPHLSVLLNLAGMKSSIINTQLPGRTGRNIDGKECAYLIDFWHGWNRVETPEGRIKDGFLLSDCRAREKVYRDLGFSQKPISSLEDLRL